MIVLDASVLIAQFDRHDPDHARAERLLDAAAEEVFASSPLTLAEVLVQPTRQGRAHAVHTAINALGLITVPFDDRSPSRLAELRVATRLKLPDCCVLLAAEQAGAALATFDEEVAAAAGQVGLRRHAQP